MSECIHIAVNVAVLASAAGMCGITLFFTGRCRYYFLIVMSTCFYSLGLSAEFFMAYSTVNDFVVASCFCTSCSYFVFSYCCSGSVSKCLDNSRFRCDLCLAFCD